MAVEIAKHNTRETSVQLISSVLESAAEYSVKQGVSLNDFINTAVEEKLAHLQHEEWVKARLPMTEERRAEALALLNKGRGRPVMPGDELPEGYIPSY